MKMTDDDLRLIRLFTEQVERALDTAAQFFDLAEVGTLQAVEAKRAAASMRELAAQARHDARPVAAGQTVRDVKGLGTVTDDNDNAPWFSPKHKPAGIPRQRYPGEEVWRLHDHTGQVQTCELRDQSTVGAGWDVLISVNGEPSFSRCCADEHLARFVAEAIRQDNLRGGWTPGEGGKANNR